MQTQSNPERSVEYTSLGFPKELKESLGFEWLFNVDYDTATSKVPEGCELVLNIRAKQRGGSRPYPFNRRRSDAVVVLRDKEHYNEIISRKGIDRTYFGYVKSGTIL